MADVIVIGAGHNGLAAAATLARAGRRVTVLERRGTVGGLAASEEFHPGYRTGGVLHDASALRTDLLRDLRLSLQVSKGRAPVTLFSERGETIVLSADAHRTARSIGAVSPRDAEAYPRYRAFCDRLSPHLRDLFDRPLPPYGRVTFGTLARLVRLRGLGKKVLGEFLQVAPMSAADFLDEWFETDFLKAGLALPALAGTYAGPLQSLTALNLLLFESASRVRVGGGAPALVAALEQAARAGGVMIRTHAEVTRILLDANRRICGVHLADSEVVSAPVVAASCAPTEVFLRLLAAGDIAPRLEREIRPVRSRGTLSHVVLALDRRLRWKHGAEVVFARLAGGMTELERVFDDVKFGRASPMPVLSVSVPTVLDPSLAPEGHEVVSVLARHVPSEEFAYRVVERLARHAEGLRDALVAVRARGPSDLAAHHRLPGGHLFHGEIAVDQLLARPVPSCAGHATPIPGLFLCGSGAAPGGGITCAPGILGARAILAGTRRKPASRGLV